MYGTMNIISVGGGGDSGSKPECWMSGVDIWLSTMFQNVVAYLSWAEGVDEFSGE
jgi:hypothetical protein